MTTVNQLSQCYATINYIDETGAPYIPTSVNWRLWDGTNNVLLQDWEAIAGPLSTSSSITVAASFNNLQPTHPNELRVIVFQIIAGDAPIRYDPQCYTVVAVPTLQSLT